jgi:hypothetical protein
MRELTSQAMSLAEGIGDAVVLRDRGGFTPATVALHQISAENFAGDPGAAVAAAIRLEPAGLPTTERRARYWTDTARPTRNGDAATQSVRCSPASTTPRRTYTPARRSAT